MKRLRSIFSALFVAAALTWGLAPQAAGQKAGSLASPPLIDMHAHFFRLGSDEVIKAMDEAGISIAVFMPVPNSGRSRRRGVSEDFYADAAAASSGRIAAFYGGNELNQEFMNTPADKVSTEQKERLRKRVAEILSRGRYKGIGELGPRHIAWDPGQYEIDYPADHPLMLLVADLAAEYGLPMDVHLEATAESLPRFERLLAHNGNAKIIWAHAGWSNTGLGTPELMRRLMARYPNLYSSVKFAPLRNLTAEGRKAALIDDKGTLAPAWKSLFEEFSERFVVGTDVKLGEQGQSYGKVEGTRGLLARLSDSAAKRIAYENAMSLLGLKSIPRR
jgi:cytosine/adenosine deaminase-related metal-dependent hydrolase